MYKFKESHSDIEIPASIKSINQSTFYTCNSLSEVEVPTSVTSIGSGAFGYSIELTTIKIPGSVTSIAEDAFSCCEKLTTAYCEENSYAKTYFEKKGINVEIYKSDITVVTPPADTNTDASTNTEPNPPSTTVVKQGWRQDGDQWYWLWSDGSKRNGWLEEYGQWYYFYGNGQMATGFINLGGTIYYLNPLSNGHKGSMLTGWQRINGYWYYFNPNSDGYKGMMKRGWLHDGGNWYYLYYDGTMAHDTTIDGYHVNSSGAWVY